VNVFRHPVTTWKLVTQHDRIVYVWHMAAPYAFAPVLSPSTLTIALPMLAVNLVSSFPYTRDAHFHYSALVLVGATIATVEGVARLPTLNAKRVLVGVLVVSSFATTIAWGPSPIGRQYHNGWWPLGSSPVYAVDRAAVALIPKDAAVSASYDYVPHLAHRRRVYEFPVPWRDVNWGVRGENLDDPIHVQWLLVDRRLLDVDGASVLHDLLLHQFVVRSQVDGIVVAQRVHNGPPP
jgi:uncharacterized membrane protein